MPRIAYVNGSYRPFSQAMVHVEDRGYQLSDGVYEVIPILGGRMLDAEYHMRRLWRSLGEIQIQRPVRAAALKGIIHEVLTQNRVRDGMVYLQITRGVAPRDHAFPRVPVKPALVVTAKRIDPSKTEAMRANGVRVITQPDLRWGRCDIKSVGLLPNVLARQAARQEGAFEAWLIDKDGNVTEGASTSAWIVTKTGEILTRPLDMRILPGCTRESLIAAGSLAQERIIERRFSLAEAKVASEAFLTAATLGVMPIVGIDGVSIGTGTPGPVARSLQDIYRSAALAAARAG
ncbi:MAG: D-amino-acid transaminase [Alphaproteobacteria bacterium]|nr:D-amino-acid transaminase [Alphaproteobacteria bacterium]